MKEEIREQAEGLLAKAIQAQGEYWDSVSRLEQMIEADIDSFLPLDGYTLDEIWRMGKW